MECKLYATHDHMPGIDKPKILRVGGTCQAPNPGYKLTLERTSPPFVPEPDRVFLRLVVDDSSAGEPGVITEIEVEEFVEEHEGEEKTVVVRGAEPASITIEHTD